MRTLSTRLRARLTGIALLAAVPALLAVVYLESIERDRARQRTLTENLRLARLAAAAEAEQFDGASRLLLTLAEYPPLVGTDARACTQILARVLRSHQGIANLRVTNVDGTLFCSGAPVNPALVTRATGKPWFERAVRTRSAAVGDVRISPVTGEPAVVVAHPLLDARGRVLRIVSATIGIDQLRRAVLLADIPAGTTLTLFDVQGTVVLRTPDGERWFGRKIPNGDALRRLRSGANEALADEIGIDGVRRLYATVPVRGADSLQIGLFVGLGVDRRLAYADADRILRQHIWLLILVTIAAVVAALVGGQTFVLRPIKVLRGVIDRIASGDLAARAELVADLGGVGDLVDGVNAMAAALDARQHERDEVVQRLRISEDRYRLLFEQNPNAMWVYDAKTLAFLEVNAAAIKHYGYSRDEFLSMYLSDIRPPEEVPRLEAYLAASHESLSDAGIWRHQRKSGEAIDVEITTHAILFEERAAKLVVAYDVSDRTRAEQALREAEERMRFALEASRVGVWETNMRTGFSTWSETCEAMHGFAPGSYGHTRESFAACIHPDDRRATLDGIEQATRAHLDALSEYRTVWPDGTVRRISSVGRFFYDANGSPVRGAGVSMDVTQQRSMEEQLRQSQKMEAVGQLAGGIAHDFNNLLTVIAGNVEIAAASLPAGSPVKLDLDEVRTAAVRAAQLTRQLLAFGRKQTLRTEPVDIDEMAGHLSPMLRRLIGEDITIECALSGKWPVVVGDRAQLEQVLINLSVNARDAMPQGGTLRIETRIVHLDRDQIERQRLELAPGTYVALSVRDTGVGMDREVLAHAFEPFFTTKEVGKGTGLGLSSVYGTVKQSGGHVIAESTAHVGTVITIYLPVHEAPTVTQPVVATPVVPMGGGPATVLLVEDDAAVRALTGRILTGAGYSVLVAESGAAAIAAACDYAGDIALVLSDVVMPGMSGLEMASSIEAARPGISVLLMSGYPEAEIRRRGMRTQSFSIVEKPFTRNMLLSRVESAIAERGAARRVA